MKSINRFLDLFEEFVHIFRCLVESYTGSLVPSEPSEEDLAPGLYRVSQDALDALSEARRHMRHDAMNNPYNDIDFKG